MEQKNRGIELKKQENTDSPKEIEIFSGKDILASTHPKDKKMKVKLYDFKRPDKFSRDQIRTLSIMHETFSRLATTTLSASLRYICKVNVEGVDQCNFGEYIQEIPNLTTLGIINMDPLKGSALMRINNTLTFSIIERLAGRTEIETPEYNRDLTDIEQSLMEEIFLRLFGNLREAWSTVIDLRPRLGQIETNPQFAQIVPPMEMVIVVVFTCKIHTVESKITLCFPYLTIEPIMDKLSAQYWYSSVRKNQSKQKAYPVSSLKTASSVFYESEKISLNTLHHLSCGSLIKIPDFKNKDAYLSCGKEHLLKLKAEKGKGSRQFFTIKKSTTAKDILPDGFLIETNQNTTKTQAEDVAVTLREIMHSYEDTLVQKYNSIEKRLKEFSAKQDELSDQLYFGSKDKELQEDELPHEAKPFHFLHSFDIDQIFNCIRQEHPQVIALILAYIEPFYSSEIVQKFPEKPQVDITERIATLDRTPPEVVHEIEMVLKRKLILTGKITPAGGIDSAVEILNLIGRGVEKTILKGLEKTDSTLAGKIKKRMFRFENIRLLDPGAVTILLEKTDIKTMILALKGSRPEVQEHILNCLMDNKRDDARKRLERIGPVQAEDIETAQHVIIDMIRKLQKEGVINIAESGELVEE